MSVTSSPTSWCPGSGCSAVNDACRRVGLWARVAVFWEMTKPRVTVMVVLVALIGFLMGLPRGGLIHGGWGLWLSLIGSLMGTAMSCMGAAVLNQVYERRTDALMTRTRGRALPTGRLSVGEALGAGLMLTVGGVMVLAVMANSLTAGLAAFTILSYALVYTPMKRVSSTSTLIGAVPGAVPPVMGYTAAAGVIGPEAWVMFGILYMWQLPHFLAIAWLYREDYARAGIEVLPAVEPDGRSTMRQVLIGCVTLLPLGLMPTMLGVSGLVSFLVSLGAGLGLLGVATGLAVSRTRRCAKYMYLASLVYLPAVLLVMLADRV